jgi:hypothetical protein
MAEGGNDMLSLGGIDNTLTLCVLYPFSSIHIDYIRNLEVVDIILLLISLNLCNTGKIPNYALIAEFTGTLLFQFMGGAAAVNAASTGRNEVHSKSVTLSRFLLRGLLQLLTFDMLAGLGCAALGNGLALMVLIYATAGISGAHLNPAVSATFWMTGR